MTPAIAAAATNSPSSSRMDQYFDENEDDFVMRIVHNSCNIPCQHYGANSGTSTMMDLDVWTVRYICSAMRAFYLLIVSFSSCS
jgi:hypothetical protein